MRHPDMKLSLGQVRQLARTFLQEPQGVAIVALSEHDPAQRVRDGRLVRDRLSRLLRQVVCLIQLSQVFGIENRKVVQSQGGIWRDREEILVGVASCSKILQLLLDRAELNHYGNG